MHRYALIRTDVPFIDVSIGTRFGDLRYGDECLDGSDLGHGYGHG